MIKVNTDEFRSAAAKLNEAADALRDAKKYVGSAAEGSGWFVREKGYIALKAINIYADMERACAKLYNTKAGLEKAATMFEGKETELCSRMSSEFGLEDEHKDAAKNTAEKSSSQKRSTTKAAGTRRSGLGGILDMLGELLSNCTTNGGVRGQEWFNELSFGKLSK